MSILVDHEIQALCDKQLVSPYDKTLINPASLDVRVGETAIIEHLEINTPPRVRTLEYPPCDTRFSLELPRSIEMISVRDRSCIIKEMGYPEGSSIAWSELDLNQYSTKSPYWVEPKEFLLVATLETFNIPENICGEFRLKSSRARSGWNQSLAVWLDPGWHGKLTMELINECRYTRLPLYPGLKIGQIIFHKSGNPSKSYRETGRYCGDLKVMGSKG